MLMVFCRVHYLTVTGISGSCPARGMSNGIHCFVVILFGIQRKEFVIEHPSKNVIEKIVIESDCLSTTCRIVSLFSQG
jgi:hypothetical protein